MMPGPKRSALTYHTNEALSLRPPSSEEISNSARRAFLDRWLTAGSPCGAGSRCAQ